MAVGFAAFVQTGFVAHCKSECAFNMWIAIAFFFAFPFALLARDLDKKISGLAPERLKPHRNTSIAIFLGGAAAVFVRENPQAFITALAGTAAAIGWILQYQNSITLSRKQHTLTILLQMRQNEIFNRHRTHLFSKYPQGSKIPNGDVAQLIAERTIAGNYELFPDGKQRFPMAESIIFIINYYEFLANGIRQGDLDDDLLRESLQGIALDIYDKCEAYINKRANVVHAGGITQSTIYEHFRWLVNDHWKKV